MSGELMFVLKQVQAGDWRDDDERLRLGANQTSSTMSAATIDCNFRCKQYSRTSVESASAVIDGDLE